MSYATRVICPGCGYILGHCICPRKMKTKTDQEEAERMIMEKATLKELFDSCRFGCRMAGCDPEKEISPGYAVTVDGRIVHWFETEHGLVEAVTHERFDFNEKDGVIEAVRQEFDPEDLLKEIRDGRIRFEEAQKN